MIGSGVGASRSTTASFAGFRITTAPMDDTVELLVSAARERRSLQVHLCNSYTMSLAGLDRRLAAALSEADLNLADGTPLAKVIDVGQRPLPGPELFRAVITGSSDCSHYLYGGAAGVAAEAGAALARAGGRIAGVETPPFAQVDALRLKDVASRAMAAGAGMIWVGLGTPKQDLAVPILALHFPGPVIPVGAAFDFVSGNIAESPEWLRGSGLEWLHRFGQEPGRLWRRYTLHSVHFSVLSVKHVVDRLRCLKA